MRDAIGQYKVVNKLGEGNYAVVYKWKDEYNKSVAVKIFKDTSNSPEVKKNFIQETSIILSFDNQNIVKYVDFGECRDGLLMTLVVNLRK